MSRYIDADKFIDILNAKADMALGTPKEVFLSVAKMVELLPPADVVPAVRCKDCKWWEARTYGSSIGRCENPRNGLFNEYSDDNDYCSYGERREE